MLSFRAFVGDVQISNWRGLTGGYPSRLFVLPLQQVVDEYTKVELRGLQSLPLRLHREEIASLLERTAQVHWSYDGRYYFVSNNCAVETAKLLQAGVPRLGEAGLAQLSPRGLKRRLVRLDALDERVLADRSAAQAQGYYFASARDHYQQLFAVAAAQLALPARDVHGWLKLPARQRAPWLLQGDLRASAGLLLLEQAAQRRAELRARDVLKRHLLAAPDSAETRSLRALLEQGGQWLRPGTLLQDGGYGFAAGRRAGTAVHGRGHGQRTGRTGMAGPAFAAAPAAAGAATRRNGCDRREPGRARCTAAGTGRGSGYWRGSSMTKRLPPALPGVQ